eukprot:4981588-Amphidinium_carterae.1
MLTVADGVCPMTWVIVLKAGDENKALRHSTWKSISDLPQPFSRLLHVFLPLQGDAATKRVDKRPETPTARFVAKCRMFCNKKLYEGLVYVALYDGALVVLPNGHLMDQAVDIKGSWGQYNLWA